MNGLVSGNLKVTGTTATGLEIGDAYAGKLYALVRSAAIPAGELRAQILPSYISLRFATLAGANEARPVSSSATRQAAATVNSTALAAAAHVTVAGLTAKGAELDSGAAGSVGTALATLVVYA